MSSKEIKETTLPASRVLRYVPLLAECESPRGSFFFDLIGVVWQEAKKEFNQYMAQNLVFSRTGIDAGSWLLGSEMHDVIHALRSLYVASKIYHKKNDGNATVPLNCTLHGARVNWVYIWRVDSGFVKVGARGYVFFGYGVWSADQPLKSRASRAPNPLKTHIRLAFAGGN